MASTIPRKWLVRLRKKLSKKVNLNWERVMKASVKASFPICQKHLSVADSFSICGLCSRKMGLGTVVAPISFSPSEIAELNAVLRDEGIPSELHEQSLMCKLCKTYCSVKLSSSDADNKPHRFFQQDYQKK